MRTGVSLFAGVGGFDLAMERNGVKVVASVEIDKACNQVLAKHFPNAKIVADRFHVIRLIQHQCMMTYRELSDKVKSNRGILALLRTRPDRLTCQQLIKRNAFLDFQINFQLR